MKTKFLCIMAKVIPIQRLFYGFLALSLLLANTTQAQDKTFEFGLQLSPQISFNGAKGNLAEGNGIRAGFRYGVFMDYNFAENYALSTGLYHSLGGSKVRFLVPDAEGLPLADTSLTHNYGWQMVEVPILFKFSTEQIGYLTYTVDLGFINYVRVAQRSKALEPDFDGEEVLDKKGGNINLFNMGIQAGFNVEYEISDAVSLIGGLSYRNAFINHISDPSPWDDEKITFHIISLNTGILF